METDVRFRTSERARVNARLEWKTMIKVHSRNRLLFIEVCTQRGADNKISAELQRELKTSGVDNAISPGEIANNYPPIKRINVAFTSYTAYTTLARYTA